jgi:CDP-6-deoxy-D-xylo-4-hexulose-3-dehydrase
MRAIMDIATRHRLWVLEDCCDALGAAYEGRLCGTFGALASLSFYPAHHITMGEGGGVVVNHPGLRRAAISIRDWGRDCWCDPGHSDSCGQRFNQQHGDLPPGYDHKYVYSNVGYNLKATDLQAAIGLAQADRLDEFIATRRRNFQYLLDGLRRHEEHLVLPIIDPRAQPSPFAFPLTVREPARRAPLVQALEEARIETRRMFGGNILRQPGFRRIEHRVHGNLGVSDMVMRDTFFVGVYPGLGTPQLDHVLSVIAAFLAPGGPGA